MACRPQNKVCFKCEEWFHESDAEYCHECTEWKCSKCGACGCDVSEATLKAIRAIVKTYESWLDVHGIKYQDIENEIKTIKNSLDIICRNLP